VQEEVDKGVAGLSLVVVVVIRCGLVCLFYGRDFGAQVVVLSLDLGRLASVSARAASASSWAFVWSAKRLAISRRRARVVASTWQFGEAPRPKTGALRPV